MPDQMYPNAQPSNNQQSATQVDANQYQIGNGYANAEVTHDDPHVWKPRLDPNAGIVTYQARVRILPCSGISGLKSNFVPVRQVPMHYLRDDATQTRGSYKCLHGLSGSREIDVRHSRNEKCPICDNLFARLKALRAANPMLSDAEKNYITRMLPSCEWYANVYIIQDFVHPENNGTVKLWKMSNKLCSLVMEPSPIPKSLFDVKSKNNDQSDQSAQGKANLKKKIKPFKPEDPIHGHVFNFILERDASKKGNVANDYGSSNYEDDESLLATTNDEINAILNQCSDLHEAADGILSEQEATVAIQNFWTEVESKTMQQQSAYAPVNTGYAQQYQQSAGYAAAYNAPRPASNAYSGNAQQPAQYAPPAAYRTPAAPAQQPAQYAPPAAYRTPAAPAQQPAQYAPPAAYQPPAAPVQQPAQYAPPSAYQSSPAAPVQQHSQVPAQTPVTTGYSAPAAPVQQPIPQMNQHPGQAYSAPSSAPTDDDDLPF